MGAEMDSETIQARTDGEAKETFKIVIEQRRYDYGHAEYTGTFAEKEDIDISPVPKGRKYWTEKELEEIAGEISKWDNAVGGQINAEEFFVSGWCSS